MNAQKLAQELKCALRAKSTARSTRMPKIVAATFATDLLVRKVAQEFGAR